jgi:CheY-like chemotaxis protein/anti-sigma regulatory factor (Ser/Thr protein kinase)
MDEFGPPDQTDTAPPTILVVDDSPVDRRLVGSILEKHLKGKVLYASHGLEALPLLEREQPTAVLTDLLMPEMDGLELVAAVRERHPLVPVVLMTAYGSEDLAIQALQRGASSYVPKQNLLRDLAETMRRVTAAARTHSQQQRLFGHQTSLESRFLLDNDRGLIPPLVSHLQELHTRMLGCDLTARIRVGIALEEAILNGIDHGNLEVGSELRQESETAYLGLLRKRRGQEPYCRRRLAVEARLTRGRAQYVVRDEGPGFDPSTLPDPTDPANLTWAGGRGLLLIRTFMDEVTFNDRGNEITLVKYRDEGRAASLPSEEARTVCEGSS